MSDKETELRSFLEEDVGNGDITTSIFVPDVCGNATIICEQDAIVAGLEEAIGIFEILGITATPLVEDGDRVIAGTKVLTLSGSVRGMIVCERTALNFLMRMSGIATLTDALVTEVGKKDPYIRIAATRKTTPGFRKYEKKAVVLGGGWSHRKGLDDAVMIKDNHILACGGIDKALKMIKNVPDEVLVEVEVTSLDQALKAAKYRVNIIMADHFSPEATKELRTAVKKIDNNIMVEASGNITMENVADYAGCADLVSLGALTHSPKAIHYSMDLDVKK